MGACKTHGINTGAKYYFNDVNDAINTGGDMGGPNVDKNMSMEQRVSLICTLKNVDSSNEFKIELILYSDTQRKAWKSGGFTEKRSKDNNNLISFEQFFAMPYFFERQQLLDFKIYNGTHFETIQTSLGSIMGSRKQTLVKKLPDGSDFQVQGREIKRSNKLLTFDINLKGNFVGMGLSYTITNLGTEKNPVATKLYDSETLKTKTNMITFSKCSIPVMFLNPTGNAEENNVLIDIKDVKHKTSMGNYKGPISQLLVPDTIEQALNHNNKAYIKCNLISQPSFIGYLRTGMNINLTIGIDFTGSNGSYSDPRSLHYLNNGMNDYEKAIRSCGDILAYYDDDQLFPVFGFGFKFIDSSNYQSGIYNYDNYPVNCNTSDPNIHLIDNVLKEYRQFITKVTLWGPTNFAPMINDLNREVKENLKNGLVMHYNILLILTDGQINDMQDTIDGLVEASFLPISVIIVGIGDGNFGNMDILDADDNPLYDRRRRKADRDLVQFVPFNDYKNDPPKLAEQVLEEIPRQVVEYYTHKGIKPKDDDDDDNEKKDENINSTDDNPGI
jgi:hypothetical protein